MLIIFNTLENGLQKMYSNLKYFNLLKRENLTAFFKRFKKVTNLKVKISKC